MGKEKPSLANIEKRLKRAIPLDFFFTFIKVFNPNSYEELSNRTMKDVFSYFFSLLFISYVVMVLVSLPILVNFEAQLNKEVSKFDELVVDLNISMSEPIYVKQLKLGIDATGDKNLTRENILITENYIQSKPAICYFKPACWFKKDDVNKIELKEYKNLLNKEQEFVSWLYLIIIFILPWLLINLFILLFFKYLLTAVVFALFGWLFVRIINRRIKIKKIFKIGAYSMTPMILLNTVNIPLGLPLLYLPFIVTLFYFVVGLILASERGFKK